MRTNMSIHDASRISLGMRLPENANCFTITIEVRDPVTGEENWKHGKMELTIFDLPTEATDILAEALERASAFTSARQKEAAA